jgi:hypothetical protein
VGGTCIQVGKAKKKMGWQMIESRNNNYHSHDSSGQRVNFL